MKEQIKMFGVCAEIFEDDLIAFLPKILKQLEKLMKEEASGRLHSSISETIGVIVLNVFDKIPKNSKQFESILLKTIFGWIEKSTNKNV